MDYQFAFDLSNRNPLITDDEGTAYPQVVKSEDTMIDGWIVFAPQIEGAYEHSPNSG